MAFKRRLHSVIVAAIAVLASTLLAMAEPYRIVGFGDSLMAGYGLNPGQGFPERLETELLARGHDVVIVNAGVSGDTTSGGLARLDWSIPDDTQLVILELGANDMLRGVSPVTIEQNLDAILAKLAQKDVAVLLAGMRAAPNLGLDYQAAFDGIFPKLARKYGVAFYPFFLDGIVADGGLLLDDGMHPNAQGVDRMVERVLPSVERIMATTPDA